MRNKIALLLMVSILLGSQAAWAQEETPAEEKPLAGWDDGFYLRSKEDQFKMKIGGRLQALNTINKIQGQQKRVVSNRTTLPDTFSNSFSVRRARLQLTGTLFEKLDYATLVTASTAKLGSSPTTVWQAWLTYNFSDYFKLSGGMVQLPMDRQQENSSSGYLTVEPPLTATQSDGGFKYQKCSDTTKTLATCPGDKVTTDTITIARDAFGLPFDLGIRIEGDIGPRFSYAAAAVNGNGFENINANNELSYGVRGQVNILDAANPGAESDFEYSEKPKLSIGFGTGFEDTDAADENIVATVRKWAWSGSGDIAFRYLGFSLNSEVYHRIVKLSNNTSPEDTNKNGRLRDVGYYANVGYYLIKKKLEGVLTAAQIFREGPDNNANEFGGGLNWYILNTEKSNKAKLQFDYTNVLDYDAEAGLNNATYNRFRLMFSLFL